MTGDAIDAPAQSAADDVPGRPLTLARRAAQGAPDAVAQLGAALTRGAPIEGLDRLGSHEAARLVLALRRKQARALLRRLPDAPSLALLQALDPAVAERLLDPQEAARIAKLVAKLDIDEAAQFLAAAPRGVAEAALAAAPDPQALRAAIDFRAETAGAVMGRKLVAAPEDWTVAQVVEEIRARSEAIDKLYAVYVIDAQRRLVGYLKIRDLLLSPADAIVGSVSRPDPVAVSAGADREEVARLARRERLKAVPVVDGENRLLGVIAADELLSIERAEAAEDMKVMAGLDPEASAADGPLAILRRRLPWLAAGLVGSSIAAMVVGSYESALTEAAILASLIPIVMSLAGNAGIQASTVTVQAMSGGALWVGDIWSRIGREIGGAALNGGLVGLIVATGIMAFSLFVEIDRPAMLALTAALTLVVVTIQASTIGSIIPLALERLKFDPAVATGVFITTSNDVVGVLIFFLIATALYV